MLPVWLLLLVSICLATRGALAQEPPLEPAPPSDAPAPAPAETPPPPTVTPPAAVETPAPAEPQEPPKALEVRVTGAPRREPASELVHEPAEQRFDRQEVRRLPGAFGDSFRAIEVLPGVVPFATGLPYFFMRGATPSSTGYFVDGIQVPFLFHLAVGPSVVNPALIDHIDVFPGGYPARYGRFVGGLVEATTRAPPDQARGEATVRLFDAGALLEVPFADGRANVLAGGRYSYTAPALQLFSPDSRLSYWDYQFGAGYRVQPRSRVSVLAFGSDDYLGEVDGDEERALFAAQFHRVQLRFDHGPDAMASPGRRQLWGPRLRLALTGGLDRSTLGEEGTVTEPMGGVRIDLEVPVARTLTTRAGADMTASRVTLSDRIEPANGKEEEDFHRDFTQIFGTHNASTLGGWLDFVWRPSPRVELVPGARLDVFVEPGQSRVGFDPRGAARVVVAPSVTSVTTAGLAHQRPALLIPVPGLTPLGLDAGLQEALQLAQGVELGLPEAVSAKVTVFHHTYWDVTDLTATCSAEIKTCKVDDRADGRAYGLELQLSRPLSKRVGGLVAYTLSRSERTFGRTFTSDFDRTHVFHAAVGYEPAPGWHLGARVSAYSGRPYSLLKFDNPEKPDKPTLVGKRNALRRPLFYRVDLRAERQWRIGKTGWISVVAEGMNVTLQKEIVDFDCRAAKIGGADDLSCGGEEIGPIAIPSLGVSGGF